MPRRDVAIIMNVDRTYGRKVFEDRKNRLRATPARIRPHLVIARPYGWQAVLCLAA